MPGLQSVASAMDDTGVEQPAGVRIGRAGRELDPRQQRCHRRVRRADERLDVGVGQEGAVVDAGGAELDGQLDPGPVSELVAVHAQPEAGLARRQEHGARLVLGEGVR